MKYLVDTGILLRLFDVNDASNSAIRTALRMLRLNNNELYYTAQNAAEFWNVATRPNTARGGYGQTTQIVRRRLNFVERFGAILFESQTSFEI